MTESVVSLSGVTRLFASVTAVEDLSLGALAWRRLGGAR
jgi:hypothetical protein